VFVCIYIHLILSNKLNITPNSDILFKTKLFYLAHLTLSVTKGHSKLASKAHTHIEHNSAKLAHVMALQVMGFFGVSNKYSTLTVEGMTCKCSSPAGGRMEKQNLWDFSQCLLLFSSSGKG